MDRTATRAWLSRSTTAAGVPAGAWMPYQVCTS
ncbi:Uncharacterised protein [Bordetella pertussis]|nr:Uncharacterised protein [Bordetella pertussis]